MLKTTKGFIMKKDTFTFINNQTDKRYEF